MPQKRATIKARFADLPSHQSELSAAYVASTPEAAIAGAVRALFNKPQVKGKRIHGVSMNVSLINLDRDTINAMMNKAEGITEEEEPQAEEPKSGMEVCKLCHEQATSLSRHLATCPAKKTA